MGHTYTKLITHVVFSTKERMRYISRDHGEEVFAYMGAILRNIQVEVLSVNGVADHVHMVFRQPAKLSLAETVRTVKGSSSKWIHEKRVLHRSFAWQRGYAAFSVSESKVEKVVQYVTQQEEHHRKVTFQDELRMFLKQHGIAYDERYLWD